LAAAAPADGDVAEADKAMTQAWPGLAFALTWRVSTMRKNAKSALSPTIACKRDTGASGAVSSVSLDNRKLARFAARMESHWRAQ
jgi:hypothetical protein